MKKLSIFFVVIEIKCTFDLHTGLAGFVFMGKKNHEIVLKKTATTSQ